MKSVLFIDYMIITIIVLFQYEVAVITKDGAKIKTPVVSQTNWDIAQSCKGANEISAIYRLYDNYNYYLVSV